MVAALVLDRADRAAIHRALGRRTSVRLCERADALRAMLAAADVHLVVTELRDAVGASVIPVLTDAVSRGELPAIVVRESLADAAAGDVVRLAGARVPARLSLRGVAPIADALVAALGKQPDAGADLAILERVGPLVPFRTRAFLLVCAASPSPRLHVERASMLLGVARRTLENRLAAAGMPPAHRIVGWCVALHAAWRLDVLGHRPKRVAADLGFSSSAAIANLLARYCGCSPTSLRVHGGFQVQLERFAALVQPHSRAT